MPNGVNGRILTIHYTELKLVMHNSGNGYFTKGAELYHYLKDIPFSKFEFSDKIRKKAQ